MPRVGREQSGTGIYHVMLRGINRQDIFEEPEDYWTFIILLIILPTFELLQTKHQLVLTVVGFLRTYTPAQVVLIIDPLGEFPHDSA